MEEQSAQLLLESEVNGQTVSEPLTIAAKDYPRLVDLLAGQGGEVIRSELTRLLGHFWRARAERHRLKIIAKLLFSNDEGGDEEEVVQVQDLSASGIRVAIDREVELDLKHLALVHFLLAVRDGEERRKLRLPAEFVRVASVDRQHLSLAFRFTAISDEEARLLAQGTHLFFEASARPL